jgi:DNA-3-methyladenine glycosylase
VTPPRLQREDFARGAAQLARDLLGQRLVRILDDDTRLSGRIVETEAYLGPRDRASHAYNNRRTPRNESMYAREGTFYVYFTYGMHHCCNVSCRARDIPEAVLIRALEPEEGADTMRSLRQGPRRRSPLRDTDLCSGPGRLCQALAIDLALDAADLCRSDRVFIERTRVGGLPRSAAARGPRIGVESAGAWAGKPLRWFLIDSPHVSAHKRRSVARA